MTSGVYPRTSEHRRKLSLANKGNVPWNKGKTGYHIAPCPEERKSKISQTKKGKHTSPATEFRKGQPSPRGMLGKTAWNKGKLCPDETKRKIKQREIGRHLHPQTEFRKGEHPSPQTEFASQKVKSWWKNPEFRAKVIAGRLRNRRPTGPEKQLIKIIEEHSLPFKYTGDGSFILEGLNPDFIETNGKKIAIDVFGDYWHTLKADRESYTEDGRKAIFTKYGWELIVIWESELKQLSEREILRRLNYEI